MASGNPGDPTGSIFYSYEQTAALLGVTESWLKTRVRNGSIAHTKLSERIIRFTTDDIESIKAGARVEPTAKKSTKAGPTPSKRRVA